MTGVIMSRQTQGEDVIRFASSEDPVLLERRHFSSTGSMEGWSPDMIALLVRSRVPCSFFGKGTGSAGWTTIRS